MPAQVREFCSVFKPRIATAIATSLRLARGPGPGAAKANFQASLAQLSLLLLGAIADGWLLG